MFPVKRLLREALSPRRVALIALGMAITTFGLFNIHRRVDVTEGGVLGMVLLLDHHFGIQPWLLTAVLDAACYFLGWRALGTKFLIRSGVATLCSSAFFRLWEFTAPFCPISAPSRSWRRSWAGALWAWAWALSFGRADLPAATTRWRWSSPKRRSGGSPAPICSPILPCWRCR